MTTSIPLSRRAFLRAAGASLALAGCARWPFARAPRFEHDPFSLGVASGSPVADGVVLWTRLAPRPLEPGGGMPPEPVPVRFRVAEDESLTRVVRTGQVTADPALAHAVHVELSGLAPDRVYFYRFDAGDAASATGRTRTAPAAGAPVARLRFAFASCQHWEQGRFAAHRAIAEDGPDLVLHLGDYIYEGSGGTDVVRHHEGPEPKTLDAYRVRHAFYKTDPALQAAHAACPWLVTWDDHEVENDYAGDHSSGGEPPASFHARRVAAYQAYYEHMPVWSDARPDGAGASRLYRSLAWGDLAELFLLDGRQDRSPQACPTPERLGGRLIEGCAARLDPTRTLWGTAQEAWLQDGLAKSAARWNVVAQQMLMAQLDQEPGPGQAFWSDGWDGYPVQRARFLDFVAERRVANPVVLGGDIHSFWVTDLKTDFDAPGAPVVASEIVGTSISSLGVPYERFATFLPDNPHVKYFESRRRGYVRCEVSAAQWTAELRAVEDVRVADSPASTLATFVIEDGRPGAQRA